MPQALAVDWDSMKTDFMSHKLSYQQLSDKYGVPQPTIRKRAQRYGWHTVPEVLKRVASNQAKHAIRQHIAQAIESAKPELDSAIREWTTRSRQTAQKLVEKVSQQLDQEQSPEDLQRLAGALDRGDGVGRRSLGMDKLESAMGGNRVLLSIAAVGVISQDGNLACLPVDYGQAGDAQPIDVEASVDGESFLGGDAQTSEPGQESFSGPPTPGV